MLLLLGEINVLKNHLIPLTYLSLFIPTAPEEWCWLLEMGKLCVKTLLMPDWKLCSVRNYQRYYLLFFPSYFSDFCGLVLPIFFIFVSPVYVIYCSSFSCLYISYDLKYCSDELQSVLNCSLFNLICILEDYCFLFMIDLYGIASCSSIY